MVLIGNELVNQLRNLCDNVKNRLWIISPFIGSWKGVEKIIGTKWITDTKIDVRLLTDIANESFILAETIKKFQFRTTIKSLRGLHAKLYVVDDKVLLTSANLTSTAFSKRYEVGILLNTNSNIEKIIKDWWNIAETIDSSWVPTKKESQGDNDQEEGNFEGLKNLWKLPESEIRIRVFKNYITYIKAYNHFKKVYIDNVKRIWNDVPVYHEIDSFLNYLFHEHERTPSKKFIENKYRKLSDEGRIRELKKYYPLYHKWVKISYGEIASDKISRIKETQKLLNPKNIHNLNRSDIEKIVCNIHSMNSVPLNKVTFLRKKNNSTKKIIESWSNLLHNDPKQIELRMEECNKELYRFGKSAIQELIANYHPKKYPVVNRNSNCGLKFLGYDIKTY